MHTTVALIGWGSRGPTLDLCTTIPSNAANEWLLEELHECAQDRGLDEFIFTHEAVMTREEVLSAWLKGIDG